MSSGTEGLYESEELRWRNWHRENDPVYGHMLQAIEIECGKLVRLPQFKLHRHSGWKQMLKVCLSRPADKGSLDPNGWVDAFRFGQTVARPEAVRTVLEKKDKRLMSLMLAVRTMCREVMPEPLPECAARLLPTGYKVQRAKGGGRG